MIEVFVFIVMKNSAIIKASKTYEIIRVIEEVKSI